MWKSGGSKHESVVKMVNRTMGYKNRSVFSKIYE